MNAMAATLAACTVLCVACGDDLTHKVGERRNLFSPSSVNVLRLWKSLFSSARHPGVHIPDDLYGGRVCRKCFASYERMLKVQSPTMRVHEHCLYWLNLQIQSALEANLCKAADILIPSSDSRKRPSDTSFGQTPPPPPPKRDSLFASSSTSKSPDVVVRVASCPLAHTIIVMIVLSHAL